MQKGSICILTEWYLEQFAFTAWTVFSLGQDDIQVVFQFTEWSLVNLHLGLISFKNKSSTI